mmetsp:Transcript_112595/g.282029  ORF Transcript_112595/g.282029 Transcript_112595/m.282029 type:complete len:548 (+) Transcript_112595:152-1795(+)
MASAAELLEKSRSLHEAGQAQEALSAAKEALEKFRGQGDQAGLAEALRLVAGGQIELLEKKAEEVQHMVKDEASKIKKSASDGRLADALMGLAAAEVSLFKGESDKALKAATDAANALSKDGNDLQEAVALQMVVNAQLMRSNTPKAMAAANASLAAAQKAGDLKTQGAAWLAVATSRHTSGGEDAKEAAQRALGLYRELGNRPNEAATQILTAQIELASGDAQAALTCANEALTIAKNMKNWPQAAAALEMVVEAQLATGSRDEALAEAESVLSTIEKDAAGQPSKGVAPAMSALLVAHTACKGIDSALALVKKYIVQLRESGDQRGEVRMLHKLGTMSPVAPEALNSAQAALALAEKIGDAAQEAAIKSTITDLYVARGKVEKAPNRKQAMKALSELAKSLESQDGDRFDDAAKFLDGYYNALKQEDIETAMSRVISKDPPTYLAFLKEHGQMIADEKPASVVTGQTARPVPHEILYFGFTAGGISYGPRYRVNVPSYRRYNSETSSVAIVQLADCSDQWERELAYNPSMLDGVLQHSSSTGYEL